MIGKTDISNYHSCDLVRPKAHCLRLCLDGRDSFNVNAHEVEQAYLVTNCPSEHHEPRESVPWKSVRHKTVRHSTTSDQNENNRHLFQISWWSSWAIRQTNMPDLPCNGQWSLFMRRRALPLLRNDSMFLCYIQASAISRQRRFIGPQGKRFVQDRRFVRSASQKR